MISKAVTCIACGEEFSSAMALEKHRSWYRRPLWKRAWIKRQYGKTRKAA